MTPANLPAPLAEPLHLLQPSPWPDRLLWLGLSLLGALALRWWLRRRRAAARPAPAARPTTTTTTSDRTERTVEEIRRRFDSRGQYRRGLHALAEAIRRHLAGHGHPSSTWTAGDIGEHADDPALASVSERLAEVRFRRREPERRDFHALCDQTEAALAGRRPRAAGRGDEETAP